MFSVYISRQVTGTEDYCGISLTHLGRSCCSVLGERRCHAKTVVEKRFGQAVSVIYQCYYLYLKNAIALLFSVDLKHVTPVCFSL